MREDEMRKGSRGGEERGVRRRGGLNPETDRRSFEEEGAGGMREGIRVSEG